MNGILPLGTRVQLNPIADTTGRTIPRTGEVVGYTVISLTQWSSRVESRMVYLIRLTCGFYSDKQDTYVSVLVCDPSSIERVS